MEGLNRPLGAPPVPSVTSITSDSENPWEFPDGTPSQSSLKVQSSNPTQTSDSLPSADPAHLSAETSLTPTRFVVGLTK